MTFCVGVPVRWKDKQLVWFTIAEARRQEFGLDLDHNRSLPESREQESWFSLRP